MTNYTGLISCLEFELNQTLKQEHFLPMSLAHLYEHITKYPMVAKAYETSPCLTDYTGNVRENLKLKDSLKFTSR